MGSRRLILGLILLTLLAMCLAAAAKLRATPKYDSIRVGMTERDVERLLGYPVGGWADLSSYECDEGYIHIDYEWFLGENPHGVVTDKSIKRRGPLERLWWLAGWR